MAEKEAAERGMLTRWVKKDLNAAKGKRSELNRFNWELCAILGKPEKFNIELTPCFPLFNSTVNAKAQPYVTLMSPMPYRHKVNTLLLYGAPFLNWYYQFTLSDRHTRREDGLH
ncbi:hypothetical protein WDV93_02075 [Pantoea ananatis]